MYGGLCVYEEGEWNVNHWLPQAAIIGRREYV